MARLPRPDLAGIPQHVVQRDAWQVESRLAGHAASIAGLVWRLHGCGACELVGLRRAWVSEVILTPSSFNVSRAGRHPDRTGWRQWASGVADQ